VVVKLTVQVLNTSTPNHQCGNDFKSHVVLTILAQTLMEILESHGPRFEIPFQLLLEGQSFTFDGVRFSLAPDGPLVVAIQSSYWTIKSKKAILGDLRRVKSLADYLACMNSMFDAIYRKHHLFILINYYGHGGEMEVARLVDDEVVWANA
jgi:hypothetical protein